MSHRPGFPMLFLVLLSVLWGAAPALATFTDNGDGTVTDNDTGLMWDQCSWGQDYIPGPPPICDPDPTSTNYTYAWSDALGQAVIANTYLHRGYDDWRLPNRTELETLVDLTAKSPAIDSNAFPNTASLWYWSSTTYTIAPEQAWFVDFWDGNSFATAQTWDYNVRLVRGGTPLNSFDLLAVGLPTQLAFTVQPGGGPAGTAWTTQPTVAVLDTHGDIVTDSTAAITLSLTTPGGATLSCASNPLNASAGQASFSGCQVDLAGDYTLTASATDLYDSVSSVFTITAGLPTVSVVATDTSATEAGLTTGTYTFTRTGDTAAALTVNYAVTGTATADSDYVALGTSVTLPAGASTTTQTLTPLDDALPESDETVILTLASGTGYTLGSPASATVTILSDDLATPTVSVAATDNTATEAGLTTGRYTFTRTGDTAADLTINYRVTGTATAGRDYVALGTSVVIPAGKPRVTKILKPKQDNLQELPETVILILKQSPNYVVGTPARATVTITSDEPVTQIVTVKATDNTATEADLTTGRYTFIRTGDTSAALTVNYKVTGTATAGSDYDALGTSVVIPAGKTRVNKTLTPKQDSLQELAETVILTLKQSPNYAVGTPASATVQITSDE